MPTAVETRDFAAGWRVMRILACRGALGFGAAGRWEPRCSRSSRLCLAGRRPGAKCARWRHRAADDRSGRRVAGCRQRDRPRQDPGQRSAAARAAGFRSLQSARPAPGYDTQPSVHVARKPVRQSIQQDFNYRGFVASPVPGTPQGIAVYQNGVRINEAYGDVVNWAFLPEVAINKLTLQPNNPVFGLNAIGGAVSIDMKNGFNYHGTQFDGLGGMYGRLTGTVQSGMQNGNLSIYAAADATNDHGWRDHSSSSYLRRMYTDLGAKGEQTEFHLMFTGADNMLGAVAATPLQLLNQRWSTRLHLAADNASATRLRAGDRSLESHRYPVIPGRRLLSRPLARSCRRQQHGCTAVRSGRDRSRVSFALAMAQPRSTRASPTPNNLSPGAFLGEIDRNWTQSNSYGGTRAGDQHRARVRARQPPGRRRELSTTATPISPADSELGTIDGGLFVQGTGVFIDQPAAGLSPVNLLAKNTYTGIYATDTDRRDVRAVRHGRRPVQRRPDQPAGLDRHQPAADQQQSLRPAQPGRRGHLQVQPER